jgi:hypothetical protein
MFVTIADFYVSFRRFGVKTGHRRNFNGGLAHRSQL